MKVYGSAVAPLRVYESRKLEKSVNKKTGAVRLAGNEIDNACGFIDVSWLKAASEPYQISGDTKDYLLVEVPIIGCDLNNRNWDAFTFARLAAFSSRLGMMRYRSFVAKPSHQDHQNTDDTKAKGVIFDASLNLRKNGFHKVTILQGFDRTKDEALAKAILKKDNPVYSMGAIAYSFNCSFCGFRSDWRTTCEHIEGGAGCGRIIDGVLVYRVLDDFQFIESSKLTKEQADFEARQGHLHA